MKKSIDPNEVREEHINFTLNEIYDEYSKLNATIFLLEEKLEKDKNDISTLYKRCVELEKTMNVLTKKSIKNYANN